jgi:5-methylcytosine-specific restriction endonuclease McrA
LAPSLDHIVPLSLGGSPDSPANLQLTHLRCNLAKRDRPAGEQLRLIG